MVALMTRQFSQVSTNIGVKIKKRENLMMNITLTLDMEQLVKSQLQTGKYATVEQVIAEALLLLEANNRRQAMSQKVKNLFDKTQAIPGVQEITESEIAAEIDAYRSGECVAETGFLCSGWWG